MSTTTTGIRTISLVCIRSPDQDRAIAFYEALGFEKRTDVPFGDDYRWVEVYPPEGTTGIALAPPPPGKESAPCETGITLTTGDIDATHGEMKSQDVDVDDEVSRMGDPCRRCSGSATRRQHADGRRVVLTRLGRRGMSPRRLQRAHVRAGQPASHCGGMKRGTGPGYSGKTSRATPAAGWASTCA